MPEVRVRRVYDEPSPGDGARVLVDRVWPRGLRRDDARLHDWAKDVAPSTELRRWYGHDPAKWEEFRRRYVAELDAHPEAWRPLVDAAGSGDVTLAYSARDREHNSALVLRDYLLAHLTRG
jgi:uncharacterized protein YeaO (DUF488 family)